MPSRTTCARPLTRRRSAAATVAVNTARRSAPASRWPSSTRPTRPTPDSAAAARRAVGLPAPPPNHSPPPLPQPLVVPPELASQVRPAPGQAQARRQVHGQRVGAVHLQALRGEAGVPFRFGLQVLALASGISPTPIRSYLPPAQLRAAAPRAAPTTGRCTAFKFYFSLFCIKNTSLSFALCVEAALVDAKRAPVRPVAVA